MHFNNNISFTELLVPITYFARREHVLCFSSAGEKKKSWLAIDITGCISASKLLLAAYIYVHVRLCIGFVSLLRSNNPSDHPPILMKILWRKTGTTGERRPKATAERRPAAIS
jgi:hypothetical protein